MHTLSKIFPLLILASALSLSSCVNQVKDTPKTQAYDTLSQLQIVYDIPDSNQVLTVHFHAVMTPPWQKNYRIDWNFGDSTGTISKFDTSNLTHYFQKYGSYWVTLSVFDTISKAVLGKASVKLDLVEIVIDTNFLHRFTHMQLFFQAKCLCPSETDSIVSIYSDQYITWQDKSFRIGTTYAPSGMGGEISLNGYSIDSAWYESGGYSYQAVGHHGFDVTVSIKYIDFQSLRKSVSLSADSLIFLSTKNDIPSKITSLLDTVFHVYTTFIDSKYLSPGRPGQSKEIIFTDREPSPILRVVFYK